jgi:hypothetical protein
LQSCLLLSLYSKHISRHSVKVIVTPTFSYFLINMNLKRFTCIIWVLIHLENKKIYIVFYISKCRNVCVCN